MAPKLSAYLSAIFSLCFAATAFTQANPQGQTASTDKQLFKLSVSTHLVLVPVIVTDKRGAHVTGLTAADFEVKEDGNLQRIVHLDELSAPCRENRACRCQP